MSAEPRVEIAALAIGKFDALHLGHRALIARAATLGRPHLLTFSGMATILNWPARQPLVAVADRARVLAEWSQSLGRPVNAIALPFAEVQPMTPVDFIAHLVARFGRCGLIVGEDFRFGRGRSAGATELTTLATQAGCQVAIVSPVLHAGSPVSSSRVRDALAAGDVALVAELLGRPYRVTGTVMRGDGRGRTIGVPTANLSAREVQDPAVGVYAAWGVLADGRRFPAAVNVGHVPTAGAGRPLTVEAHLLGFSGDCYGQALGLYFIHRLRNEQRFADLAALTAQIHRDVAAVRTVVDTTVVDTTVGL